MTERTALSIGKNGDYVETTEVDSYIIFPAALVDRTVRVHNFPGNDAGMIGIVPAEDAIEDTSKFVYILAGTVEYFVIKAGQQLFFDTNVFSAANFCFMEA